MLAVLVIVVPFCVTVMTDGTRLGACVGGGLEMTGDVARVVGIEMAAVVLETTSTVVEGAC
jgi:hypothetical protein